MMNIHTIIKKIARGLAPLLYGRGLGVGLLLFAMTMQAQNDFNPADPAEPQVPVFYYPLTVACDPTQAGNVAGSGNYAPGTTRTVSTSAKSGYSFSHWTLNGVRIEDPASFSYTTVAGPMAFVAHYDLDPVDPAEPTMNVKSHLYLASEPEGICTFNRTSGALVQADNYVTLNVTNCDQWYEFTGWYKGNELVSNVASFNYLAEYAAATLTAHFRELPFTPTNPDEPVSQGGNIQTLQTGDANGDGSVDVTDAVAVINAYLTSDQSGINAGVADVNHDGVIDITDAVAIINLYLNSQ